jgi:hypothetical protein
MMVRDLRHNGRRFVQAMLVDVAQQASDGSRAAVRAMTHVMGFIG